MHIEAIIIRRSPVREHDQRVVLYSRELGKVTAVAKSSLRPQSTQALAVDEGNSVRCELVQGRAGPIMTGTQVIRSYSALKRSPLRWAGMQFFLHVIDAVVFDEQPDSTLWDFLVTTATTLETVPLTELPQAYRRGQGALLSVLGYGVQGPVAGERMLTRCALDDQFEQIAQRRLASIDLFYAVAAGARS